MRRATIRRLAAAPAMAVIAIATAALLGLAVPVAGALPAAPGARAAAPSEIQVNPERVVASAPQRGFIEFSHKVHSDRRLKTKCTSCHLLSPDGNRFRPTSEAHCIRCHKGDKALATFKASLAKHPPQHRVSPAPPIHTLHIYYDCLRCHRNMTMSDKVGDVPLPPVNNSTEVCVECHSRAVQFSHAKHVNVDGNIAADCAFCHPVRGDGIQFANPGHPQCWACHNINLLGLVEGCNLCHLKETSVPRPYNLERASLLHKEHPRDKVPCDKCHAAILTASTLEAVRAARVQSQAGCASCHVTPKAAH